MVSASAPYFVEDWWIRAASPRMTLAIFGSVRIVLFSLQDGRLSVVADQFPDRARPARRGHAGDAMRARRPPVSGAFDPGALDRGLFAARELAAVSAGAAV